MEVDYKNGSGLQEWKWITRMEVDYKDGSGLQFVKFDFVTGRQEIKTAILGILLLCLCIELVCGNPLDARKICLVPRLRCSAEKLGSRGVLGWM